MSNYSLGGERMAIGLAAVVKEAGSVMKEVVEKAGEKGLEKGKQTLDKVKEMSEADMDEMADKAMEYIKKSGDGVLAKIDDIKNLTPEQLLEKMRQNLESAGNLKETNDGKEDQGESEEGINKGLTDEEKAKIKEETGWSDEIIDAIGSWKEYEIYKDAGLVEAEIGGKKCLIRTDIDWEQKDAMGRTNRERAEQGLSPINKDGKVIELHHIGQHPDSPLAELTQEEHRGKGNDTVLHDKTKVSEIDRQVFAEERGSHWAERANESEANS